MSASPPSTTQNMDLPIHYQTIFLQPNIDFHLLFSKYIICVRSVYTKAFFKILYVFYFSYCSSLSLSPSYMYILFSDPSDVNFFLNAIYPSPFWILCFQYPHLSLSPSLTHLQAQRCKFAVLKLPIAPVGDKKSTTWRNNLLSKCARVIRHKDIINYIFYICCEPSFGNFTYFHNKYFEDNWSVCALCYILLTLKCILKLPHGSCELPLIHAKSL